MPRRSPEPRYPGWPGPEKKRAKPKPKPKPKPPPAPPVPAQKPPRSVFAGVGMLTSWDWRAALRLRGHLDWVAVHGDARGEDGSPLANPDAVRELRAAGFDVHAWYSWDHEPGFSFATLGVTGYIGQAEGPDQLAKALAFGPALYPERRALISNVTFVERWPAGWFCIGEAYANANPSAAPGNIEYEARKRGAQAFSACYGLYDASSEQPGVGRRVSLREYRAGHQAPDWCGYLSETLSEDDVAALLQLPR